MLRVRCSYLREDTCPNTGFSHLENLRSHCTDVPIMYKLLQSVTIEPDPEKAQIFLVPFLMGCNAMLGWGHGMQRVNAREHHSFFGDFKRFAASPKCQHDRHANFFQQRNAKVQSLCLVQHKLLRLDWQRSSRFYC